MQDEMVDQEACQADRDSVIRASHSLHKNNCVLLSEGCQAERERILAQLALRRAPARVVWVAANAKVADGVQRALGEVGTVHEQEHIFTTSYRKLLGMPLDSGILLQQLRVRDGMPPPLVILDDVHVARRFGSGIHTKCVSLQMLYPHVSIAYSSASLLASVRDVSLMLRVGIHGSPFAQFASYADYRHVTDGKPHDAPHVIRAVRAHLDQRGMIVALARSAPWTRVDCRAVSTSQQRSLYDAILDRMKDGTHHNPSPRHLHVLRECVSSFKLSELRRLVARCMAEGRSVVVWLPGSAQCAGGLSPAASWCVRDGALSEAEAREHLPSLASGVSRFFGPTVVCDLTRSMPDSQSRAALQSFRRDERQVILVLQHARGTPPDLSASGSDGRPRDHIMLEDPCGEAGMVRANESMAGSRSLTSPLRVFVLRSDLLCDMSPRVSAPHRYFGASGAPSASAVLSVAFETAFRLMFLHLNRPPLFGMDEGQLRETVQRMWNVDTTRRRARVLCRRRLVYEWIGDLLSRVDPAGGARQRGAYRISSTRAIWTLRVAVTMFPETSLLCGTRGGVEGMHDFTRRMWADTTFLESRDNRSRLNLLPAELVRRIASALLDDPYARGVATGGMDWMASVAPIRSVVTTIGLLERGNVNDLLQWIALFPAEQQVMLGAHLEHVARSGARYGDISPAWSPHTILGGAPVTLRELVLGETKAPSQCWTMRSAVAPYASDHLEHLHVKVYYEPPSVPWQEDATARVSYAVRCDMCVYAVVRHGDGEHQFYLPGCAHACLSCGAACWDGVSIAQLGIRAVDDALGRSLWDGATQRHNAAMRKVAEELSLNVVLCRRDFLRWWSVSMRRVIELEDGSQALLINVR